MFWGNALIFIEDYWLSIRKIISNSKHLFSKYLTEYMTFITLNVPLLSPY